MLTMNLIVILAVAIAFYCAFNIGGNDVANAMGTPVASKALTYKQAVAVAAIFEFCGAFFVGSHVTDTVRKGMIDMVAFQGEPQLVIYGMTAALIGTTIWLRLATQFGWPVSTTHSIVGAVVGFGIVAKGVSVIKWAKIGSIVASWFISPIVGGVMAFLVFTFIRTTILENKDPVKRTKTIAPFLIFTVFYLIVMAVIYKGLKNLHLDLSLGRASLIAAGIGIVAAIVSKFWIDSHFENLKRKGEIIDYTKVEKIFMFLQIITASYIAFAHGANDVANAIGPLAAVVEISKTNEVLQKVAVPMWILAMGGVGIVVGLLILGSKVMETIGKKITEIVPTRGFSAEISAATMVLVCSKLGLPVSTTHTIVGAVIGVGFARGIGALDLKVIRDIFTSWFITLPAAMVFTILAYKLLLFLT